MTLKALIGFGLILLSFWIMAGSLSLMHNFPIEMHPIVGFPLGFLLFFISNGFFQKVLAEARLGELYVPPSESGRIIFPEEGFVFFLGGLNLMLIFGFLALFSYKWLTFQHRVVFEDLILWLISSFFIWIIPIAFLGVGLIYIALGVHRFGKIPFVLISAPVQVGRELKGFLWFPNSSAPERVTAELYFCEKDKQTMVTWDTFRQFSEEEMLTLIKKTAPEQLEQISQILSGAFAWIPINLSIPERKLVVTRPGGIPKEGPPFPRASSGVYRWTLEIKAEVFGVDLTRVYPLPMQKGATA